MYDNCLSTRNTTVRLDTLAECCIWLLSTGLMLTRCSYEASNHDFPLGSRWTVSIFIVRRRFVSKVNSPDSRATQGDSTLRSWYNFLVLYVDVALDLFDFSILLLILMYLTTVTRHLRSVWNIFSSIFDLWLLMAFWLCTFDYFSSKQLTIVPNDLLKSHVNLLPLLNVDWFFVRL